MFAGRCDPMAGPLDGEQHVIAAAHHVVMALEANNLTDEVRKLLSDFNIHLSKLVKLKEAESRSLREIETRLVSAQHTITTLQSTHPTLIVDEYLQAIDVVQSSAACLDSTLLLRGSRKKELFDCTQEILQMAMTRLQTELTHILVRNEQLNEDELDNASLRVCPDEDSSDRVYCGDVVMDFIHPDVIPQIKSIANTMFGSGYGREFCHTFTAFVRNKLAEYLDVHKFRIEDVARMERKCSNLRIRAWPSTIKRIVGVYLPSAKRFFDQILGEQGRFSSIWLMEASKAPLLCLLNFGQAVSIGPHRPEWLFCLLNMYQALPSVILDMDALFPDGIIEFQDLLIKIEFQDLLIELGDSIRVIFKGFGNYLAGAPPSKPYTNGGIHPLTTYVMNYILYTSEYSSILESILHTRNTENSDGVQGADDMCSEFRTHLRSWTSILEDNLLEKSNLYKDCSLSHIFMMNNLHYMVQKIVRSKIRDYFGNDWIRCHIVKFRQQAMSYERLTLGSMVPLLREPEKAGNVVLEERCKAFTAAFENMYKNQTRWCVLDIQLRKELRIPVSRILIPAYRSFVNAVTNSIGEKNLEYSEQDLSNCLLDLLEGTSKSMNHLRKR